MVLPLIILTSIKQTRFELFLPLNRNWGLFYKKSCFSPVKNIKKCRERDSNALLLAKNNGLLLLAPKCKKITAEAVVAHLLVKVVEYQVFPNYESFQYLQADT